VNIYCFHSSLINNFIKNTSFFKTIKSLHFGLHMISQHFDWIKFVENRAISTNKPVTLKPPSRSTHSQTHLFAFLSPSNNLCNSIRIKLSLIAHIILMIRAVIIHSLINLHYCKARCIPITNAFKQFKWVRLLSNNSFKCPWNWISICAFPLAKFVRQLHEIVLITILLSQSVNLNILNGIIQVLESCIFTFIPLRAYTIS